MFDLIKRVETSTKRSPREDAPISPVRLRVSLRTDFDLGKIYFSRLSTSPVNRRLAKPCN